MKVLITDDHALFIDGLRLVLEDISGDAECLVAQSTAQALTLVENHPNIDVALIDLQMPDADGILLIKKISRLKLGIPMILLSATDEAHKVRAAMQAGALGFLPKSANRQQLYTAIEQVLSGNVSLPEDIAKAIADIAEAQQYLDLTERQKAVLRMMVKGHQNKHIADSLSITENTVKFHIKCLFTKLETRNRTECVEAAKTLGLLEH